MVCSLLKPVPVYVMHPPVVFSLLISFFIAYIHMQLLQQSVTSYVAPFPTEKAAIWAG